MPITSILLDIIILAILVGCILYHAHKGFLSSLLAMFGTVVSLIVSHFMGSRLALPVFNGLFRQNMVDKTARLLQDEGVTTLAGLLDGLLGFLPDVVLDSIVEKHGASLTTSIHTGATDISARIVDEVVAPLLLPLISFFIFILLFLVLRLLVSLLSRLLADANKIPVLGKANRVLGGVAGALVGALYCAAITCAIWLVDAAYGVGFLGTGYFSGSVFYRMVYELNFFV